MVLEFHIQFEGDQDAIIASNRAIRKFLIKQVTDTGKDNKVKITLTKDELEYIKSNATQVEILQ